MLRKINFFTHLFLLSLLPLTSWAQIEVIHPDSVPPKAIYKWKLAQNFADLENEPMDTTLLGFHNYNPIFKKSISNTYLGNLGSPYISNIYFDRNYNSNFIFLRSWDAYMQHPEESSYYNTKTPFSNVYYSSGGPSRQGEEELKLTYSRNVNKDWNLGFFSNLIYGRGLYANQATRHPSFTLSSSYVGERYSLHFAGIYNDLQNFENGGITSEGYITRPDTAFENNVRRPESIPTHFSSIGSTRNRTQNKYLLVNQRYRLGYYRDEELNADSIISRFIPVTSFIHTLRYERDKHWYTAEKSDMPFYENIYIDSTLTNDITFYQSLKNTVEVQLHEGAHRFAKFGLSGYVTNDLVKMHYPTSDDTTFTQTLLGGRLMRQQGKRWGVDGRAEVWVQGRRQGDYRFGGDVWSGFPIGKDSLVLKAGAWATSTTPDFLEENYFSNHFKWQNNFSKTTRVRFQGAVQMPTIAATFRLRLENVKDYIYFNQKAFPDQYSDNIQILEVALDKNFVLGKHLHWDNSIIYQTSSNQNIIPLPDFSVYTRLYYQNFFFTVLKTQIGVDCVYNSEFYAPGYMPAIGQFYVQQDKKTGNYPLMNAYVNIHWKRARIFLMMYHVNKGLVEPKYFSSPDYPLNPRMFKFGISWNFYD